MRILTIFILAIVSTNSFGAWIDAPNVKVTEIFTYTKGTYAGDVVIRINSSPPSCEAGFFISNADIGKEQSLSSLLSAFHTDTNVRLYGRDDRWGGSTENYCQLHSMSIKK